VVYNWWLNNFKVFNINGCRLAEITGYISENLL